MTKYELILCYVLLKAERQKVAGDSWFNMPAPEITPEIKNDLKIIQIRNSLDRSHYYKSSDWKKSLPKYFQVSRGRLGGKGVWWIWV